eukprot:c23369_g1_i1 orf=245-1612(-)
MKRKVTFGTDLDENPVEVSAPTSRNAPATRLSSFTDMVSEEQTCGLSEKGVTQHDAEPCLSAVNLTIRLKIPKGTQVGEADTEEDDPYAGLRTTMLANYRKKQDFAPMDAAEATCQIEGCTADLSCANGYFRRNKVCQKHFRAVKVDVGSSQQRFCQQCNRFHVLAEFDEYKRSCRLTLAGHNNRRKRSQPEATSVLSSGTLVYLPGKLKQGGKNLRHVDSLACEDLERTITNEEKSDTENNLRDDASSEIVYKEKSCHSLGLANPISNISKYTQSFGESEKLGQVLSRREGAPPEPISNVSISASKSCSSKNSVNKKRSVSQVGYTNMCQVEGCTFDLSNTKDYFRRRKVCEWHFKASKVKVQNVEQRFCQQCSRFHVLAEFEEGRKSCKKMLMCHNMRRRKGQPEAVSRMMSKDMEMEDYDSLKAQQLQKQISRPLINLRFETSRDKKSALIN